jgi:isocitrate dehydrogenase kinase/phosphatase
MERADWLDGGFDSAESRFLMVTAITHHRFNSAVWGHHEIRKLYDELAEIEAAAAGVLAALRTRTAGSF